MKIYKGDYKKQKFSTNDADGDPYDLTSTRIVFKVVDNSDTVKITKDSDNGATEIDIPSQTGDDKGVFYVIIDATDTNTLSIGTYYYDIVFVENSKPQHIIGKQHFKIEDVAWVYA